MDHNVKSSSKSVAEVRTVNSPVPSKCVNVPAVHQASNANKSGSPSKRMVCCSISSIDCTVSCIVTKTRKQTNTCYSLDPIVRLLRLPSWISTLKTVHISQECVVPSTDKCLNYSSLSALTKISNKRLTRSVGATLDVSCSRKLPDFRPQKPKYVDHEYGPFLGFNPEEDYFLSNNHSYQFLSSATERVDEVFNLALADTNYNVERCVKKEPEQLIGLPLPKIYPHYKRIGSLKHRSLSKRRLKINRIRNLKPLTVPQTQENDQNVCQKDFCQLGCVCKSLRGRNKPIVTRCAHEECMFSLSGDGCLHGFSGTPNRVVKMLFSNQPSTSTDQDQVPTKRIRKPTKRWLVEEEENELQHLIKKKFKHDSCVPSKDTSAGPATKDASETPSKSFDFFGARLRCLEHNRLNCRCLFELHSSSELTFVSDKVLLPSTPPKAAKPVVSQSEPIPKSDSPGPSKVQEKTDSTSGNSTNLNDSSEESINFASRSRHYDTVYRKYFTNRKNYCRVARSDFVLTEDLESMCISTLDLKKAKSIILMKWPELETKIKERSAYMWVSHLPKRVARVYITEDLVAPDSVSIVMDDVRNVLSKSSTTEYFFKFWKKYSVPSGCCILVSHETFWELYGNLELASRNEYKCLVKLQKFPKEATPNKNLVVLKSIRKILVYEHGGPHNDNESRRVEGEEFSEQERLSVVDEGEFIDDQEMKERDEVGTNAISDGTLLDQISLSSNDINSGKIIPTIPICNVPCWYRLRLSKVFDKLSVKNPLFIATYSQLTSAVRISKTNSVPVKIVFGRGINYKFEGKTWKQGIYADYSDSKNSVLIGPYFPYEKPGIKAFYDLNGIFFHTPVLVTKESMRRSNPNILLKRSENPEVEVTNNPQSNTNGNCVTVSAKVDTVGESVPKMRSLLPPMPSPPKGNTEYKIRIGNVKNILTVDPEVKGARVSATDMQIIIAPRPEERQSTSNADINAMNVDHNVPVVESENSEPDFGFRIESVLGNFTGFDEISSVQETGSQNESESVEVGEKSDSNVVSGYLVADISNLLPIAVYKGGDNPKEDRKITIRDSRWLECGFRKCFSSVDDARHYLQSIIRVRFYPETLRICWAFVRVDGLHSIEKSACIYHPADLTKSQFITPRGVFSYDSINVNQFQKYGLKTHDLHRLLEYKRRIVIREAKNELLSLFPDANVCTLLKAIQMAQNAIKHLERTNKSLTKEFEGQMMKKKFFLAKIKREHGVAAMTEVMRKLDAQKKPSSSNSDEPKMARGHHSKSPKKSKGTLMRSTLTSSRSHSGNIIVTHNPTSSPVIDNSVTPVRDTNQSNFVRVALPVNLSEFPNPERTTDLSAPQSISVPSINASNREGALSLLRSPIAHNNGANSQRYSEYCTHGSPLRSVKKTVKSDAPKDGKTLFSGRLVSAATKKSLRKYSYIIPRSVNRLRDLTLPDDVTVLSTRIHEDHDYTNQGSKTVIPLPAIVAPDVHSDDEIIIKQEHDTSDELPGSISLG